MCDVVQEGNWGAQTGPMMLMMMALGGLLGALNAL